MSHRHPRGRGTGLDPANRFTGSEIVLDGDELDHELLADDEPATPTRYIRDTSQSVVSTNDSPDIGFDASLNPYRGCSHGCSYCLHPDSPVSMADGTLRPLAAIRVGDHVLGTTSQGDVVVPIPSRVSAVWTTERTAFRIRLSDGTGLITSADHRFLTADGWKHVAHAPDPAGGCRVLGPDDRLVGFARSTGAQGSSRLVRELRVAGIDALERSIPMMDITTGSGDFFVAGVVAHNCYARPTHEYLGLSAGLDFERIILVKERAPELLEAELSKPSWRPKHLTLSGVTDPYQPVERQLRITRRCLQVLARFGNPVSLITKNALVMRDIDVLRDLAAFDAVHVTLSITTLDEDLRRVMEPRTSTSARRLAAVRALAKAGVSVGVNVAPIIPGLNDHEVPRILEAAAEAGARSAGHTVLRLPGAVAPIFVDWLRRHRPERAQRVLSRVMESRGGKLNESRFGARMRGTGAYAEGVKQLFELQRTRLGLDRDRTTLSTARFFVPGSAQQLPLFDPAADDTVDDASDRAARDAADGPGSLPPRR